MSMCCGGSESSEKSKTRGCTDVICLSLFVTFWGILIFIAAFAFVIGDPVRLIQGQDSFGNTCGKENDMMGNMSLSGIDMTDKPYLFFINNLAVHQTKDMDDKPHTHIFLKICISKCPEKDLLTDNAVKSFESEINSRLCAYDISSHQANDDLHSATSDNQNLRDMYGTLEEKSASFLCAKPPIYSTKSLLNRCVPSYVANVVDNISNIYAYLNGFDMLQQIVSDIYAGRWEILGMVGLSLLLSFIVAFTIHCLASIISWIIMVIASMAVIAGTGVLWWTYIDLRNTREEEATPNENAFLVFSITATVFTVILLLIVLVLRKRVHILVRLFKEAGRCIRSMPLLLLQPIFTFICLIAFYVFWLAVLLALATAYYPVRSQINVATAIPPTSGDLPAREQSVIYKAFPLVDFTEGSWVHYTWWYHVIALVWTSEFILGCQQMVVAGAVASWYFARDRATVRCPVGHSIYRLIVYHIGSVALGSFLITIFKIPRLILTYVTQLMKKYQDYKIVTCCLKCCTCCLWCMEKCIRYLNHNAYTVIAIQGEGFCTAAQESFNILVSNALQVATINSVGDFILFLGKCAVSAFTTLISVLIMKNNPELHFYAIPVLIVCLFSFFIANCVLSIYEMVIDTIFLCVCEDVLKNDGSSEKPYYGGSMILFLKGKSNDTALKPLTDETGERLRNG